MPPHHAHVTTPPGAQRAAVSNGSRLQLFGDQRSAGARRFRDLVTAFALEAGGVQALPETGRQLVRRLAQVSVELELLEAERASGRAIDPVAFVTLVNSQRRQLRDLDKLKASNANTRKPSLADHLARNYGTRTTVTA